jgi:hypothetical protein
MHSDEPAFVAIRRCAGRSVTGHAWPSGGALLSIPSPTRTQEADVADQRIDIDLIDELTTDHHEALELLDRIASIIDPDDRRNLADTVISEIVRHAVSEEM